MAGPEVEQSDTSPVQTERAGRGYCGNPHRRRCSGLSSAGIALALAAALSVQQPAHAKGSLSTGNEFLSECGKEATAFMQGLCLGYVIGLSTNPVPGDNTFANIMAGRGLAYCTPESVTNGQLISILTDYIERNPRNRHQYTLVLYFAAMSESFPCADGTRLEIRPEGGYRVIPGKKIP